MGTFHFQAKYYKAFLLELTTFTTPKPLKYHFPIGKKMMPHSQNDATQWGHKCHPKFSHVERE
jgi:hypothetical protein